MEKEILEIWIALFALACWNFLQNYHLLLLEEKIWKAKNKGALKWQN